MPGVSPLGLMLRGVPPFEMAYQLAAPASRNVFPPSLYFSAFGSLGSICGIIDGASHKFERGE
jgi:hypothetical protein